MESIIIRYYAYIPVIIETTSHEKFLSWVHAQNGICKGTVLVVLTTIKFITLDVY